MEQGDKFTPWLRLVYDSSGIPARTLDHVRYDDRQLSLPLPEPDVVIIMNVHDIRYGSFKNALNTIRPKWIFDIRATPRLDKIGGSRNIALKEFDSIGSHYVDLFGILGINNYKHVASNPFFWTPVVESFLRSSNDKFGPYFALLDDDLLINTVSKHFAASISHATGKSVTLSRLAEEISEVG